MKVRRADLASLMDRDRTTDDAVVAAVVDAVSADPEAARTVKDQLLMDNLLSLHFSPARRAFTNRVLGAAADGDAGARFIARTLAAGRRAGGLEPPAPAGRWAGARRLFVPAAAAATAALGMFLILGRAHRESPRGLDPQGDRAQGESAATEPSAARPSPGVSIAVPRLPRLTAVQGRVYLVGVAGRSDALAGTGLAPGEGLITVGTDSGARVDYPDGTRLELGADGSMFAPLSAADQSIGDDLPSAGSPGGKTVFLARGQLAAIVAPQPSHAPLLIITPHAEATLDGRRFSFTVSERTTRVDVKEGRARVAPLGPGAPVDVGKSQSALIQEGSEPTVSSKAPGGQALLLVGSDDANDLDPSGLNPYDRAVKARLEKLGFEVLVRQNGTPSLEADARRSTLVAISTSASSLDTDPFFRDLPVPIFVWEWRLYGALGMTGSCVAAEPECGSLNSTGHLVIKNPAHVLAAGLTGTVRFETKPFGVSWGTPTLDAAWIATLPGYPTQPVIFAYERGARMTGLAAPARRVGFFIQLGRMIPALTAEGWALFDAAVYWCAEKARVP